MKYCSECGNPVTFEERALVGASRFVCTVCGSIFHQSPRLAAACIAEWKGQILLCRRAVQPAAGLWGLPAGFLAARESASAAAARETLEEAGVDVEDLRPYGVMHIPDNDQLRVVYLGRLVDNHFKAGPEALEAGLFGEAQIPWEDLAFATTRHALKRYFADRQTGIFGFFFADIVPVNAQPHARSRPRAR